MIIWRVRITCLIPKATNKNSEYVMLIAFPLQQCVHERASVLPYMYLACLLFKNSYPRFLISEHLYKYLRNPLQLNTMFIFLYFLSNSS